MLAKRTVTSYSSTFEYSNHSPLRVYHILLDEIFFLLMFNTYFSWENQVKNEHSHQNIICKMINPLIISQIQYKEVNGRKTAWAAITSYGERIICVPFGQLTFKLISH